MIKGIRPKKNFNFRFLFLRADIIIGSTLILGVLLLISAILEIRGTKQELMYTLREQGEAMMLSVEKSIKNAVQAFDLVESMVADKLLTSARFIEYLDYTGQLSEEKLKQIAKENNIYRVNVFDRNGNRIFSTSPMPKSQQPTKAPTRLLEILQSKQSDELLLGFRQGRFGTGKRFAVAKKRRKGGVIVLNIDAHDMLEFRKNIGAGKLLRDIGATKGVLYVILQDSTNVLMASEGVTEVTAIESDPFLQKAIESEKPQTRITKFHDQETFEIVKTVYLNDHFYGLLRIGLSARRLRQAEANARERAIVVSLLLLVVGVAIASALIGAQNYKNLQNAYNRIETYTGNILVNMTDAVVAVNRTGEITLINRAAEELFNIRSDEALNNACALVLPTLCPYLQEALETGELVKDRIVTVNINNKELILSISISFLYDEENVIDTAFAVIKDLTEQKKLEENLKRKDQLTAMGHLASGVAHEIRNPLNAISMIAQRFQQEFKPVEDEEEYEKLASTIVSETRRINDIIQQFLSFARPPKLQLQETDIAGIVDHVVTLLNQEAKSKGVTLEAHCTPVPPIAADSHKLQQALLNLVKNSLQACSEGGHVRLECREEDSRIRIDITDDGNGIAQEHLNKIFNLYFTTKEEGTGLGLSIVQQIISQHNGTIEVKSEPGNGTRFTIFLPKGV